MYKFRIFVVMASCVDNMNYHKQKRHVLLVVMEMYGRPYWCLSIIATLTFKFVILHLD